MHSSGGSILWVKNKSKWKFFVRGKRKLMVLKITRKTRNALSFFILSFCFKGSSVVNHNEKVAAGNITRGVPLSHLWMKNVRKNNTQQ
jgi:hypothetical protein